MGEVEWDLSKYPPHLAIMRQWSNDNDNMPDGAFFALAEEIHDWGVEDWVELAEFEETLEL